MSDRLSPSWRTKQVLVMRRKFPDGKGGTMGMRKGKELAQAGHAWQAFLTRQYVTGEPLAFATRVWLRWSYAKVTLQVDTEEELLAIAERAKEAGVACNVVKDAGLTEFAGQPTVTCLALGPDWCDRIDPITKDLKLY